jgi:hypothetical protein
MYISQEIRSRKGGKKESSVLERTKSSNKIIPSLLDQKDT